MVPLSFFKSKSGSEELPSKLYSGKYGHAKVYLAGTVKGLVREKRLVRKLYYDIKPDVIGLHISSLLLHLFRYHCYHNLYDK